MEQFASRIARAAQASAESDAEGARAQVTTTTAEAWERVMQSIGDVQRAAVAAADGAAERHQSAVDAIRAAAALSLDETPLQAAPDSTDVTTTSSSRGMEDVHQHVASLAQSAVSHSVRADALEAELMALRATWVPHAEHCRLMTAAIEFQSQATMAVGAVDEAQTVCDAHAQNTFAATFMQAPVTSTVSPRNAPAASDDVFNIPTPPWWTEAIRSAEAQVLRFAAHASEAMPASAAVNRAATASSEHSSERARLDAALADLRTLTIENGALAQQLAHLLSLSSTLGGTADAFALARSPALFLRDLRALGMESLPSRMALQGPFDSADDNEPIDLSPLCFDDALALVERMREMVRLLAAPIAAPQQEQNSKRHRAEDERHAPTGVTLRCVASCSIGCNTDPIAAIEAEQLDVVRATQARLLTASTHDASASAAVARCASDALDSCLELLEQRAGVAASDSAKCAFEALASYSEAASANSDTIRGLADEVSRLRAAQSVNAATIATLQGELEAALLSSSTVPTLSAIIASTQQQVGLLLSATNALRDATSVSSKARAVDSDSLDAVARTFVSTVERLEVQAGVLTEVLESRRAGAHGNVKSEGIVGGGDQQDDMRLALDSLKQQLSATADALRDERQRAVDALDGRWRSELDAQEAREALRVALEQAEHAVPLGDVVALQDRLREETSRANTLEASVLELQRRVCAEQDARAVGNQAASDAALETADRLERLRLEADRLNRELAAAVDARNREAERGMKSLHDANVATHRAAALEKQIEALKYERSEFEKKHSALQRELTGGAISAATLSEAFPDATTAIAAAFAHAAQLTAARDDALRNAERAVADMALSEGAYRDIAAEVAQRRTDAARLALELAAVRRAAEADVTAATAEARNAVARAKHVEDLLEIARRDTVAAEQREAALLQRVELLSANPAAAAVRRHGLQQSIDLAKQVDEIASREADAIRAAKTSDDNARRMEAAMTAAQAAAAASAASETAAIARAANAASELEGTQEALASERDASTRLTQRVAEMESALSDSQDRESELRTAGATLRQQLASTEAKVAALDAAVADLNATVRGSAADNEQLRGRMEELLTSRKADSERMTALVEDNINLQRTCNDLQRKIEEQQARLTEARAAAAAVNARGNGRYSSGGGAGAGAARLSTVAASIRASTQPGSASVVGSPRS